MQIQKKPGKTAKTLPLKAEKAAAPPVVTDAVVEKEVQYSKPEVAKILKKAIDVIKNRGWTVGNLVEGFTGKVCAIGAINVAGGAFNPSIYPETGPRLEAVGEVAKTIYELYSMDTFHYNLNVNSIVFNYNDSRTKEDVLRVFDKTIKRLEIED